jgi:hypothetical protein
MKFLQEMIAKKRAGIDPAEAPQGDFEDDLEMAGQDADVSDAAEDAEEADAPNELFDDGAYEWDIEGAEDQSIPAPEAANDGTPGAWDGEDEVDADVNAGVANVLREMAARAKDEPEAETVEQAPKAAPVSIQENVEKLKIQRKIWDMEQEAKDSEATADDAFDDLDDDYEDDFDDFEDDLEPAAKAPTEERFTPPVEANPIVAPVAAAPAQPAAEPAAVEAAKPRVGRVKTRLLGFHKPGESNSDPIAAAAQKQGDAPAEVAVVEAHTMFPVGWIMVMEGPGRGASFTLTAGVSKIGRGEDQAVRLDFGDNSISRDNHAAIAYDEEQRTFFIGHGGKANLVRLNDMPVLSTEALEDGDLVRIGETSLRFLALCGPEFAWEDEEEADHPNEAAE